MLRGMLRRKQVLFPVSSRWWCQIKCLTPRLSTDSHASSNHHFLATNDFVRQANSEEIVLKFKGLEKLEEHAEMDYVTGEQLTCGTNRFKLRVASFVQYDLGKSHVRYLSDLLSANELSLAASQAERCMSSVAILHNGAFHIGSAAVGMLKKAVQCKIMDLACFGDVAGGALVQFAEASGSVLGFSLGGVVGTYIGAYSAGAALALTGLACPSCIPYAISTSGVFAAAEGSSLGSQLLSSLAHWMSDHSIRPFVASFNDIEIEVTKLDEVKSGKFGHWQIVARTSDYQLSISVEF